MLLKKISAQWYVDRILDACMDTAVAVPDNIYTYESIEKYSKDNDMEMEYVWLGMWMYDERINFDKEIDKYCKKHNTHSRNASHEILESYFTQWKERSVYE